MTINNNSPRDEMAPSLVAQRVVDRKSSRESGTQRAKGNDVRELVHKSPRKAHPSRNSTKEGLELIQTLDKEELR